MDLRDLVLHDSLLLGSEVCGLSYGALKSMGNYLIAGSRTSPQSSLRLHVTIVGLAKQGRERQAQQNLKISQKDFHQS